MRASMCPIGEPWGPISAHREFDFTVCFENVALLGGIDAVFALFALFNLWNLGKGREIALRRGWILSLKTVSHPISPDASC